MHDPILDFAEQEHLLRKKRNPLQLVAFCAISSMVAIATAQKTDHVNQLDSKFRKLGEVSSKEVIESSGIAPSLGNEGYYWTHNDGKDTRLFLLDKQGTVHALIEPRDVEAYDVEDICCCNIEGMNFILIGDVGDNQEKRKSRSVFFVPEPKIECVKGKIVRRKSGPVQVIHFRYPDGSHDCESMAFDVQLNEIWLATKKFRAGSTIDAGKRPRFYRLVFDLKLNDDKIHTAIPVADIPDPLVTAMDFSADNSLLVTRTYGYARLYTRRKDQTWVNAINNNSPAIFGLPMQKQGEAICFSGFNKVLATSEAQQQPIWEIEFTEK